MPTGPLRPALAVIAACALAAPAAANPAGLWQTASGDSRVQVAPCGTNMCGTLAWVRTPGRDDKNAVVALRTRALVGITLFDMKPTGGGEWSGPLYDHRSGRTYPARIRLDGERLAVTGCLQGVVCQTTHWTRTR